MQLLLCSSVMQNTQILYWVPIIFVVTCFRVPVVKTGHGLLDYGTLKSAVTQKSELIKWADFLACWYTFRKADVNLVIIGWAWSKMGKTFRSYIESKIRCIWQMIWLIKQIDSIIFRLTTNLLCIFDICWVSTAVVLVKNDVLLLVPTGK